MNRHLSTILKKILTKLTIIKHNSLVRISSKEPNQIYETKLAIQFHIFFIDLLDEVYKYLNNLNYSFDLYITTDTEEKRKKIQEHFNLNKIKYCNQLFIQVVQNKGRDIYPFIYQISPVYDKYEVIGHFHTKKSLTSQIGDRWRNYLYENLLGINYTNSLIEYFINKTHIGFITPPPYYEIIKNYRENLLKKDNIKSVLDLQGKLKIPKTVLSKNTIYPAGNMFFARTDAIKQIFDAEFTNENFPSEEEQVENTLQHTIELIWQFLVEANGFKYVECLKK